MAIALLAGSNGHFAAQGGSGGTSGAGSIDTTGATCLWLAANYLASGSGGVGLTVSDSKGNTWSPVDVLNPAVEATALYYAANPTVGSGHTFSAVGTFATLAVIAASGVKTVTPLDQHNAAAATGVTSHKPGSITPSEDGEILIACFGAYEATSAYAIDSGFTIADQLAIIGGVNFEIALAYQIQTTATARDPQWTWTTGSYATSILGSFRPDAGGGGGGAPAKRNYGFVIG